MRKTLAALLIIFSSLIIPSANAGDQLEVSPSDVMKSIQPANGSRGMLFVENMDSLFPLGYIQYSKPDPSNMDIAATDWNLCNSWSDLNCNRSTPNRTEGYVVLGKCINTFEIGCVQDLAIQSDNGKEEPLKYVGPAASNVKDIAENLSLGIPRSSSHPIFEDSTGRLYVVRASLRVFFASETSKQALFNLSVDVTPVVKVADPSIEQPETVRLPSNVNGLGIVTVRPTREDCISIDAGICYKALKSDPKTILSLDLRVPTGLSGWMNGRLANPQFSVTQLNAKSQRIKVSAQPVVMPIAGGFAKYSDLTPEFLNSIYQVGFFNTSPSASYFLVSSPSQSDTGFKDYLKWSAYFNDKALTTVTNWSFATRINAGQQFCLKSGNEIAGIVSSNASAYSSEPPKWDAATATLSYQVASPHFDETGKVNVGTYSLVMSTNTLRCLYSQNSLPPSATVSVVYGNDVISVATVSLKSDADWVYFSANGFHYSNPTIQVKFAKSPPAPGSSSSIQAGSGDSSTRKIQWCAKGYAKKKVIGANPACPKGYKKIPDPLAR